MKENEPVNIRVKITGQKVHDVGYRYFLMDAAMSQGIERFRAFNRMEKGLQTVDVALRGPSDAVAVFRELVGSEKPEDAAVSKVEFEDYEGTVPKLVDFAQILTAGQLIKAIPVIQNHTKLLIEIRDHTAETAENLREDIGLHLPELHRIPWLDISPQASDFSQNLRIASVLLHSFDIAFISLI